MRFWIDRVVILMKCLPGKPLHMQVHQAYITQLLIAFDALAG